jgi:hypothetical protein
VGQHMAELENLSFVPVQAKLDPGMEAIVVAAAGFVAVAEVGVLAPCSAAPIPSWHLEDCRLPCQQKPWGSCMEGCRRSKTSSACLALSFVALIAVTLVEFSLPLASVCLLRPWRATSSSSILLPLAIAAVELAVAP